MPNFILTDEAKSLQEAIDNNKELSEELSSFQDSISCSDGFWYGVKDGGYIDLAKITKQEVPSLTLNQLFEISDWWEEYSVEF